LRRVVALVLTTLVLQSGIAAVVASPSGAASSANATDPIGDNAPSFDARGDITAYGASYSADGSQITTSVSVRTFTDPVTSPPWIDFFTGPGFYFDTTDDGGPDYFGFMLNDGLGAIIAPLGAVGAPAPACEATPSWSAGAARYSITFPATCIDSPSQWRYAADFIFETATTVSLDETAWSAPIDAPLPPSSPTNVSATGGNGQATVTWSAASPNGSPVTGYVVTASPGGNSVVVGAAATSATVGGLTNGIVYTFTVRAQSAAGDSAPSTPSNSVTPAPTVPGVPPNVQAIRGNQQVTVVWNAAPSNGSPITKYTVHVSPGGLTVDTAATIAVIGGLTNGVAYTFTVTASSAAGTGAPSAPVTAVPAAVPSPPTNVHGTAGNGVATVAWNAPAANGSPITKYTVTASPGGAQVSVAGTKTSATLSLPVGTYTFTVVATNAVGNSTASTPSPQVVITRAVSRAGYRMVTADGNVYTFGDALYFGSPAFTNWPAGVRAAAMVNTGDGAGYWVVSTDGSVRSYGSAGFFGHRPPLAPGEFVSTMSVTPSGKGYWLFTNRGRAIRYGDAKFYGDMSGTPLNGPVIASVATPTGKGYYMVGSDGGVFTFGDARFRGSMGGVRLNQPVTGLSPTPDNKGYWLVASDGGVFAFNAPFRGSMAAVRLNQPINGLVPFGNGYLMVASDGGVFNFSNKGFYGSLASEPPPAPVVGIAAFAT
jgi:hypothetical protein